MVETFRRKFRRIRGDVGELRILHEREPLHEVLAERLDQDVVGAERRESLGGSARHQFYQSPGDTIPSPLLLVDRVFDGALEAMRFKWRH